MRRPPSGPNPALKLLVLCLHALGTLAFAPDAGATETDQYYAIGKELPDSLKELNRKVNRDILGALDLVNRRSAWNRYSCDYVAMKVYQRFRIKGLHKIELWAEHTDRLERVPGDEAEFDDYYDRHSVYRNDRFVDWGLMFGVKATFNVAGIRMGADKLSHFFQQGWKYYKRYRDALDDGMSDRQALESVVRWGVDTERGTLGLSTTGIFSFGDLEANFQGFRFFQSLCRYENPRIMKTSDGWELKIPFDWRDYVSPAFDESYNNSAFTEKRGAEVRANLRESYCPRLDSEPFRAHYDGYAAYSTRSDDFNRRFVRELIDRGEAPDQDAHSIWTACGGTKPERGAAGGRRGGQRDVSGGPSYETPPFDDPVYEPMIELGGGGIGGAGDKMNVLLRVRLRIRETVVPEDPHYDFQTPEYLIWASLDADMAVIPGQSTAIENLPGEVFDHVDLPYVNIRFTPVERRFEVRNNRTGNELAVGMALLPSRLTRFIEIDRNLGIEVSLAGVRGRVGTRFGEHVTAFASLAMDALGYKAALHVSDLENHHGIHAATLAAEAGATFEVADGFDVSVVFGGRSGISLGWGSETREFSALSDMGAYAEVRADIMHFFRVFVRGQVDASWEPGNDRTVSGGTLLFGASFHY